MSSQIDDWCGFFAGVEANPRAMIQLTIRQLLQAREHVANCDSCNNRVERVLARAPQDQQYPSAWKN